MGKTQLAAEYLHRHRDDYDLIVWLNAERIELVPASSPLSLPP
ncbi:hypothetical protein AB0M46_37520 [Dactylosporangium sp. NPDC051485]